METRSEQGYLMLVLQADKNTPFHLSLFQCSTVNISVCPDSEAK